MYLDQELLGGTALPSIVVDVTRLDMNKGIPGQSKYCAIALALYRAGFSNVAVGRWIAIVDGREYKLPQNARRFVNRYDWILTRPFVKPFRLELRERAWELGD